VDGRGWKHDQHMDLNGEMHSSAPNTGTVTASSASGHRSLASGTVTVNELSIPNRSFECRYLDKFGC
jgi:hypothetical protein